MTDSDDALPGPPEFGELDFSQAHFLDHSIWRCGQRPEFETGGRRRHIEYAWDLIWRPRLKSWTVCRIGRHHRVKGWAGRGADAKMFIACANCGKSFSRT